MTDADKQQPDGLEPGIYFNLDEDRYHQDPALGSSDKRNLRLSPPDFWWGSAALNPDWEPEDNDDTPARLRGRAMHKLVLEGEPGFAKLFARGPTQDPDATPAEKAAVTKAAKAKLAGTNRNMLPAKDYDRIAIAGAMISKNPKLAGAFQGGIPEVSIFWDQPVEHGSALKKVRCKARLDYLKPRGVGDLKSITNIKKIEFKRACREAIANYRYDQQGEHYLEARRMLPRLLADGCVHGDHDADLLKRIAAEKSFAFQFVFFQASKAPVTYSVILSPANPMIELAGHHNAEAAENYLDYLETFGAKNIWLMLDEPTELMMEEMPSWHGR